MHSFRKWIRIVFGFSRRETNGFLVILILLLFVLFSRPLYEYISPGAPSDYYAENKFLDSLMAFGVASKEVAETVKTAPVPERRLFFFDPNSATLTELEHLGVSPEIAQRIDNYRAKGGRFRSKEDLRKIYGLDEETFRTLESWIRIVELGAPVVKKTENRSSPANSPRTPLSFDLNLADTAQLKQVYGIGTVLADRIVRFRDKLGGFVTLDQLYEVYHLDSIVVEELKRVATISNGFAPQQIDLNTATEAELSAHPYISVPTARMIVAYRFQHGRFQSVAEIRNIQPLNDQIFAKLEPYVSVE